MRRVLPGAVAMALLAGGSAAGAGGEPHYGISVGLLDLERTGIRVESRIRMDARPPSPFELELAKEMDVLSVESGGSAVPFAKRGERLSLDLSGIGVAGRFELSVVAAGFPSETLPPEEGALVRSVVSRDLLVLRREIPWYPRIPGAAATWDLAVSFPAGDLFVHASGEGGLGTGNAGADTLHWKRSRPGPGPELVVSTGTTVLPAEGKGLHPLMAAAAPAKTDAARGILGLAARSRRAFEGMFGPCPVPVLAVVEVPDAFGAATVLAGDSYLLVGSRILEAGPEDPGVAALVPHEVARLWWGRAAGFADFSGRVMATYATLRFIEENEGTEPALRERRQAVENLVRLADRGKTGALSGLPATADRVDPELWNALVFQKGMMLLVMAEDAAGRERWDAHLAKAFADLRGRESSWKDLRAALERAGRPVETVFSQWDSPEIPALRFRAEKSPRDRRWTHKVRIEQALTEEPFRMEVAVKVETSGDSPVHRARVERGGGGIAVDLPSEPQRTILDPEWRLLASRPGDGKPARPLEERMKEAFAAVNRSDEGDPETCLDSLAAVRGILREGPGAYEALCFVGAGRLLFRLGRHGDARRELARGLDLGRGAPFAFHRRWAWLRLGCMEDLDGNREKALEWYRKVLADGVDDFQSRKAKEWSERAYRGYAVDR